MCLACYYSMVTTVNHSICIYNRLFIIHYTHIKTKRIDPHRQNEYKIFLDNIRMRTEQRASCKRRQCVKIVATIIQAESGQYELTLPCFITLLFV